MTQSILLVDDEQSVVEILASWLEEAGYKTYSAANGLDGLLAFNESPPDLVIADLMMPQIDGYELCRMMREMSPVPILILSGLGKESDKKKGYTNGANDYLTKPIGMKILLNHVSTLLRARQSDSAPELRVLRGMSEGPRDSVA